MVFPELLRGVLASDSLEDLRAARVLVYEGGNIIHVLINDDVHA